MRACYRSGLKSSFMMKPIYRRAALLAILITPLPHVAAAQATIGDYQRAMGLRDRYQPLATNVIEAVTLPFDSFTFLEEDRSIEFPLVERQGPPQGPPQSATWRCTLDTYTCGRPERTGGRGGRGGGLAGPLRPENYTING